MKIKRIFAKDMRNAIRKAREELGPEAVILSNSQVEGGIEIVAAIDYDEALLMQDAHRAASDEPPGHDVNTRAAAEAPSRSTDYRNPPRAHGAGSKTDTRPAGHSTETPRSTKSGEGAKPPRMNDVVWMEDPAISSMRSELQSMRSLLEQQLSGLAWGELARRNPMQAKVIRKLVELDINPTLCRRIADAVADFSDFDTAWRHALGLLSHQVRVTDDLLDRGGIFALVGPTGVGKTTTIAKLAARYALRKGRNRVALISTDNYRVGGHEQLRTYGRILEMPVRAVANDQELREAVEAFGDKDLILIDTAGMSQRDMRLSEQLNLLRDSTPLIKTILVLSAATHRAGVDEIIQSFHRIQLDACIITKLDETTSLGGAVSELIRHQLPVAYVSDGQRVPEDIHPARAHNLISRSVSIVQQNNPGIDEENVEMAYHRMTANAHG